MKANVVISFIFSAALMLMPAAVCAAPATPVLTGVALVTQTGFDATWGAVDGASGYQLDVAANPLFSSYVAGFTSLDVVSAIRYSVGGLNSGVTYYYRIRAYDINGQGLNSNVGALVTLPATPGVPTANQVTAISQTGFTATWTVAGGASGYQLDVATDAGFSSMVSGYSNRDVSNVTSLSVSGLSAGTSYFFRVRAYNSGGTSANSNTGILVTQLATPAAPVAAAAASILPNSFTATWGSVSGATGYRLDVSTSVAFTTLLTGYSNKDAANVTSYNVSGLTAATPYFYRVRATNAGGTSANSATIALVTQAPNPTAPVAKPATSVTQSGFTANWDAVSGANGYLLDVATDAAFVSPVSGYTALDVHNVTTFPVTGLSPGVAYFYRIRSYDSIGPGMDSNICALVTLPATPAVPVGGNASSITPSGFSANWSTAVGAAGYQLDVATDSGFSSMVSGYSNKDVANVTSFPVNGLSAGTAYYFRVRSYNGDNTSVSSNYVALVTLPAVPGIPVVSDASAVTQASFTAVWTPVGGATGYLLDVSTTVVFSTFVTGFGNLNVANVSSYNVAGLTAGVTYYYRVRAYNAGGTSANSVISALVTMPKTPAAPVATAATSVTLSGFTAKWGAVSGANGYLLDIATDSVFTTFVDGYNNQDVVNVTSIPISGLTAGTSYYYRVRAYNNSGASSNSNTIALTTVPVAPLAAEATAVSQTGFTAHWGVVSGATGYRLDVASDAAFATILSTYKDKLVTNATSLVVSGITPGTVYYYRLRAYTSGGTGDNSNIITLTTLATPIATAATTVTSTGFVASWNPAIGASGYRLDVATNSTFTGVVSGFNNLDAGDVTSTEISGLTAGATYFYRVRAYNSGSSSVNSNTVSQTTLAVPVATAATAITQTGFTAAWLAAGGATGYRLDVATNATFTSFVGGYSDLDVANVTSWVVSGLTAGVTYYYRVRAYTSAATSGNSNTITQITLGTPVATPATTITQTGFKATWGAVSGATGYRLDVGGDAGFTGILSTYDDKNVLNVTSYAVSGLTAGTPYYYRVRAYNATGPSVNSNTITLTTIPPPPLAISATMVTPTSFTANWNSAQSATGYRLDVATNSTFTTPVAGYTDLDVSNVTSYPVSGLAVGAVYYYRIRAANVSGSTVNSNTISQFTLATPVATAATAVTQTGFTATWGAASGATGYLLDVAGDAAFSNILSGYNALNMGNVTSSPVSGLTAGSTYYYRVRAYTSAATSSNSNTITQITLGTPVATPATTITQTGFKATWGAVSGATGYRLDVATDSGFTYLLANYTDKNVLNVTSYAVTGLAAGTDYFYRVRAFNSSADSVSSDTISLTTIPPAPVATSATAVSQTGFIANWNPALSATGYRLDVALNSTFSTLVTGFSDLDAGNATSATVTGLSAATTYYYRVRANNAAGSSGNSNTTSQSTLAIPVATAATAVTQTGFTATWNPAGGASGYRLDVATDSGFTALVGGYDNLDVGNLTSSPVSGLTAGITYFYRVRAYTSVATSSNSNTITQITLGTPVATPATTITQTGFKATWGAVSGATGYRLDVATDSGFTTILASYTDKNVLNVTSYAVTGLAAGTEYFYRVRASNTFATSDSSNVKTLTTISLVPVATSATAVTPTSFTINWNSALSATGYRLDVATNSTFSTLVTGLNDLDVGSVSSYPVSGLTVGATYYYRIRAVNPGGTSGNSNVISQTTLTTPVAVAATFVTQTSFNATWGAAGGATGYLLDVAIDVAFNSMLTDYSNLDVGDVTSAPVSGLAAGAVYYYRVRAYTSVALTGNSNTVTQITLATPVASAATSVTQTSFKATWGAVSGATGYRLDVATDSGFINMIAGYNDKNALNVTTYPVSGLTAGIVYYYRVRSFNATATSSSSNVISTTTFPAVPVATVATAIIQTGFNATWNPALGATSYRLDVASNTIFTSFVEGYSDLDVKNVTSYAISGLTAGVTYYYRIRACNVGGISVSSAPAISVTTVPPAPVAVSATTVTQDSFKAAWNAASGASGYMLDVASDSDFTNLISGYADKDVPNVTSYLVSGLTSGTRYYYRIRAVNSSGTSGNSNVITQATMAIPVAAPATLVTQTGFTATWGTVNEATTYKLDVATNTTFTKYVTGYNNKDVGIVTSSAVSGLTAGATYYYRVRAISAGVTSANSNVITQATLATPVASPATAISQSGFTAAWSAATSAVGYQLDVATDAGFTTVASGYYSRDVANVTSFAVSGLSPGSIYYFRVRSYSSGGASTNSNTITLTTLTATPVVPVASYATSVTQYAFTANWGASGGATGYQLDVAVDAGFTVFVNGYNNRDVAYVTSAALTGLAAGTTYYYRVRAYNSGGTSSSSGVISQTTMPPTFPVAPVVAAVSALTSTGFTTSWSAVIGADGYVLDVAGDAAFAAMVTGYANKDVGNVTSFTISGLDPSTAYYYRLRTYNAAGTSAVSNTVTAMTLPAAPLASAAISIGLSDFTATWGVVNGATGYLLDVSLDPGFAAFVVGFNNRDAAKVTSLSVSGLTAATPYYYRVRAYNAAGVGLNSNTISTTTLPAAPVAAAAHAVTRTGFTATWGAVSGADGYYLDVDTDSAFSGFVTDYSNRDAGNATSSVVSGLTAGTTYYYRVRAFTSGGAGASSNTIIQATLSSASPAPVATPATRITQTGFTAIWGAVYGASGYRIDVSSTVDFSSIVVGYNNYDIINTTSVDVVGLIPGSVYYYRVRDYNNGGSSADSNVIMVATASAPLTIAIEGSGGGSVHSDSGGIACISGSPDSCSALYDGGVAITLTATPDSSSIFSGWAGACSGSDVTCLVTMDTARNVTATFAVMPPVRIFDAEAPRYFETLQAAYDAAADGEVIQLRDGSIVGNLVADRPVSVTVKGGFDATYSGNVLDTQLLGRVTLQQGTVRIERVRVGV